MHTQVHVSYRLYTRATPLKAALVQLLGKLLKVSSLLLGHILCKLPLNRRLSRIWVVGSSRLAVLSHFLTSLAQLILRLHLL